MADPESHGAKSNPRPSESDWHDAKGQFPPGAKVFGVVTAVVPFGLFVDLSGSPVAGLVTATGFSSSASFGERATRFPVGATIDAVVLGPSESRHQIHLKVT